MQPESQTNRMRWLGYVRGADATIDGALAVLRGKPALDHLAYGISEAANHSILWHAINCVDLGVGAATGNRRRRQLAIRRSVIQGIEQAVVNGPVKTAIKRRRPVGLDSHAHRLRRPITSSFPSGHATAGACAAELLGHDLGYRRAWWALAVVVGWSRVHVGVHHPSDVLAGWAIGAGSAHLSEWIWPPTETRHSAVSPGPTRICPGLI